MSRRRAGTRKVAAVMGTDGRVYFEFRFVPKPSGAWMLESLSFVAAAAIVGLALFDLITTGL